MRLLSRSSTRVLTTLLLSAGAGLVSVPSASADVDPCAGVAHCHVVAHVDVNGNGTTNAIGIVRSGADGAQEGRVTLRVQVGNRVVTASRRTTYWYGALWQGAANVDGRPGKELFVGRVAGAHTLFFSAFTYRDGRLVELAAPGRTYQHLWVVDGSVMYHIGWVRRTEDPPGLIRYREAIRNDPPNDDTFNGVVKTFRWTRDGWVRTAIARYPRAGEDRVSGWTGFHVKGLQRY